ncbi:MAG: SDR family oxidoreductase [Candidatus Moranbacteria bacterium]|nr:SDR family oxidoreductase [Candidatus Moranbacteria bacterium]
MMFMFGHSTEKPFSDRGAIETDRKRIIITGGTEGIGRAISEELSSDGHEVAICARTQERLDELRGEHEDIVAWRVDLSDRHAAAGFVRESIAELDGLDVLILNAAATGMKEGPEYVFKVNQVAQVAMTREAVWALKHNHGRVVFLSSSAKNIEGAESYGASKKRMEEWLREFSERPESEGIGIFSVIPGSCDTRMHQDILKYGSGAVRERTTEIIRKGALRDPQTVGKIISKMALSGMKFNPETGEYDIPIGQCEVVMISEENIKAESEEGPDLSDARRA